MRHFTYIISLDYDNETVFARQGADLERRRGVSPENLNSWMNLGVEIVRNVCGKWHATIPITGLIVMATLIFVWTS